MSSQCLGRGIETRSEAASGRSISEVGDSTTFLTRKTLFFTSTSPISFINFKTVCSSDKNVRKCLRCLSSGGRYLLLQRREETRAGSAWLSHFTEYLSVLSRQRRSRIVCTIYTRALFTCATKVLLLPLESFLSHSLSRAWRFQDSKKCKVKSICK